MNFIGLGQAFQAQAFQSHTLVTSNLTGNFIPSTGINTHFWDNQVGGGKNLRRFNGVTHNNSAPHNFQFDGSNDYFGEAELGYGGDAFKVDGGNAFTLAQWYKHVNNARHVAFALTYSGGDVVILWTGQRINNQMTLEDGGGGRADFTNFTFSNNTWYYIAVVHHGSNQFSFFVNGSLVGTGSVNITGSTGSTGSAADALQIGKTAGSTYTQANIKIGHVHVYSAAVTSTKLRQNYLSTHEPRSTLLYGANFTA